MRKIICSIIILLLLIPTVIFAKEIELVSITPIYDSTSGLVVNTDNDDFSATFNAADQQVKFEAIVKNITEKDIIIESINITSPTYNFMSYKVTGLEVNDLIKPQEEKKIEILVASTHASDILQNFEDKLIVEINGKYKEIAIITENPPTGVFLTIVLIPIWIIGTVVYVVIRKRNKGSVFKFNMILLIITMSVTITNINALQVLNLKVIGKIDYKSLNVMKPRYPNATMVLNPNGGLEDRGSYFNYTDLYTYNNGEAIESDFYSKRYYITDLEFISDGRKITDYDYVEDLSINGDKRVMGYIKKTGTGSYTSGTTFDLYTAYIVADGKIYFPEKSTRLFDYLINIESFEGIENIGTDYVKYMDDMFYNFAQGNSASVYDFDLDFSSWNLSNVVTMRELFKGSFNYPSRTEESHVSINFEGTDFSSVLDMSNAFQDIGFGNNDNKLTLELHVDNLDVSNVKTFYQTFECLMRYQENASFELKGWTMNGIVYKMFANIGAYVVNDVYFKFENLTINNGAEGMFNSGAGHQGGGIVVFEFDNIKIKGSAKSMLSFNFASEKDTNRLIIRNWDTSEVTDMSHMFEYDKVKEIDISSFDTSNVQDVSYMFMGNSILDDLNVSTKWNIEQVSEENTKVFISSCPIYNNMKTHNPDNYYKQYLSRNCSSILSYTDAPLICK